MRNDDCQLCELHLKTREVCKWGYGNTDADLMIIHDTHPSRQADKLLTHVLTHLSVDVDDIYQTSAVKCGIPRNKKYRPKQMGEFVNECFTYLEDELQDVDPSVVLIMGSLSLVELVGEKGITKWSGIETSSIYEDAKMYASVSPAYVLRNPNKEVWLAQALYIALKQAGYNPKPTPQTERYPYEVF